MDLRNDLLGTGVGSCYPSQAPLIRSRQGSYGVLTSCTSKFPECNQRSSRMESEEIQLRQGAAGDTCKKPQWFPPSCDMWPMKMHLFRISSHCLSLYRLLLGVTHSWHKANKTWEKCCSQFHLKLKAMYETDANPGNEAALSF